MKGTYDTVCTKYAAFCPETMQFYKSIGSVTNGFDIWVGLRCFLESVETNA